MDAKTGRVRDDGEIDSRSDRLNLSIDLRHVHYDDYLNHSMNAIVKPTASFSEEDDSLRATYPSLELR